MHRLKVLFDTDPGVDDAMALLLLARHPRIDLIGVTTGFGNADLATCTRNALYLKQVFGFAAPVSQGAGRPLVGEPGDPPAFVHGLNGLGEVPLPDQVATQCDPRPAHRLLIDLIRAHPGEVTVIAVGRSTNLAHALAEDPGIVGLVRAVVVMGGAFGFNGHTGNVTPVAEANVLGDPHAADLVLGAAWPVTMVGLDVTYDTIMSDAYVNDLAEVGGADGRLVRAISQFYQDFHKASAGIDGFYVNDSSAVVYALHPEFYTTTRGTIRVVPDGIARGQTIIKREGKNFAPGDWDDRPLQTICVGVRADAVLRVYRDTILSSVRDAAPSAGQGMTS